MSNSQKIFFLPVMLLFLALLSGGCSSTKNVVHDYDKEAPFEQYLTYKIVRPTGAQLSEAPNIMERDLKKVEQLVSAEMEKRGYTVSDEPDLVIGYYIRGEKEARAYTTGGGIQTTGAGGAYNGVPYSVGPRTYNYVDYRNGTLVLDIIDQSRKQIIYHGAASEMVKEEASNKEVDTAIKKAVHAIFFNYKWKAGVK